MKRYVYTVQNGNVVMAVFSSKVKAHEYAKKQRCWVEVTVFILDDSSWPLWADHTTDYSHGKVVA